MQSILNETLLGYRYLQWKQFQIVPSMLFAQVRWAVFTGAVKIFWFIFFLPSTGIHSPGRI